jgi:hypothetical protein
MLTLMLGSVVLALTYGAFWHNQPARRQHGEREDQAFRLGDPTLRVSNPIEREERIVLTGKDVVPTRETEFFRPVLQSLRGLNRRRRISVDRTAVESSIPAI